MDLKVDVDGLITAEVSKYLEPRLQQIVREYILLDRNTAFEELSVSRAFFDRYIRDKPQVKLAERRFKESDKVFYEPDELRKAILSITNF